LVTKDMCRCGPAAYWATYCRDSLYDSPLSPAPCNRQSMVLTPLSSCTFAKVTSCPVCGPLRDSCIFFKVRPHRLRCSTVRHALCYGYFGHVVRRVTGRLQFCTKDVGLNLIEPA
jgi:hypothetical protein